MPVVKIYTKTFCSYCWRAKMLLEAKGVEFQEISVDFGGEQACRDAYPRRGPDDGAANLHWRYPRGRLR